ncbi:MAG: Ig-like domain-containing protein, partial [Bacilli bacterium]
MNKKSKIIPFSILTMLLVVGSGVLSSCSGPSTSGTSTTTTTTTTTSDSTSTSSSTTTTTTTTIPVVEVTSVTLSDAEVSLEVESTKQLTVVVLPATATVKDVTWTSSNIKFATVSTSGLVTAVAEGTATITATSGTCSDTCVVTVKKKVIPVTSVTLSEKAIHVEEKLTHKLTATIAPTTATIQTVDWSSSATNFATVDATGLVTAVAPGESTITAKAGDKTDTCKVTVTAAPIAVTSVEVTPAEATLEVEATQQLTVVVLPETATVKDVAWTSNKDTVATVSTTGLVTAISEGTATITATSGDFSDTCVVTVKPKVIPVDSVKVTPATATLEVDAKKQLSVEVLPANATDRKVTWTSSNSDFATVVDGLVTAIAKGEATITATAGAFSSTCVVTVKPKVIPVESITVEPTSVSIEEKQTQQLTATVLPDNATDRTVTWTSSISTVATVDAAGLVTALIPGDTIITATAGDKTATCAVKVTAAPIPVDSVTITPASVTIEASHTEQLTAKVLPANATDPTVAWTTNNAAVATVDSNGLVTAIAQGSAIITATAESKTANCTVTVTPQIFPVTSVEVTPATATLIE